MKGEFMDVVLKLCNLPGQNRIITIYELCMWSYHRLIKCIGITVGISAWLKESRVFESCVIQNNAEIQDFLLTIAHIAPWPYHTFPQCVAHLIDAAQTYVCSAP